MEGWEAELIGWAAGVTHEIDIGAKTPGSVPIGPISRYEDGIDLPAKKISDANTRTAAEQACTAAGKVSTSATNAVSTTVQSVKSSAKSACLAGAQALPAGSARDKAVAGCNKIK